MKLINLTAPFHKVQVLTERLPLKSDRTAYTGMIYYCNHGSMETSYLDLPGHIAETDDGFHAANIDLCDYYRRETMLLRITPPDTEYGITPDDLEAARNGRPWQKWVIINALGHFDDGYIPSRKIYLTLEAVDHLIKNGVKLIFSDAWESCRLEGVFLRFFEAGVSTVCNLANLSQLPADGTFEVSIGFIPYTGGVTQIPVSVIAEIR